jgi:hypothetical protein
MIPRTEAATNSRRLQVDERGVRHQLSTSTLHGYTVDNGA